MAEAVDFEELNMLDERKQTLEAALAEGIREFVYEYDFGDSWRHRIAVKPLARPNLEWHYPAVHRRRAGGAFDPEGFDLNAINRTLRFGRP